ncbi:hypothetical protein ACH5RR_014932 [Cinchona calisaya]|uniref:Glabrous enhancer-binding protein-like DBD domain-containing protein n=1 Tax=Cinchona calisaya TaxID=153742 RepID=A0ABD2ZSV3_9GENT
MWGKNAAKPPAPDPPVESEEEEEASTEEGSESEPEPELPQTQTAQTSKKPDQPPSSSEDEESGSETDSETAIKKPDPNIKPIASKPMEDPPQKTTAAAKKPRSKPNSAGPPTSPTSGAGAKRPAAAAAATGGDEKKDAKRSKRKPEAEAETSDKKGNSTDDSKKLFQRLWSDDDEIAILKGMIDYSAKKKADPVADLNAFLEFIKKNLHIDVSRTQLQDKIRRLKKKYENNAGKATKGSKERILSKPHEQKAYDLSKKIWGNEKDGGGEESVESPKVNGTTTAVRKSRSRNAATKVDDEVVEERVKDLVSEKNVVVERLKKKVSVGCRDSLRIEEWVVKNGMELIEDEKKRAEFEEKWTELKVKEIELFAWKSELMAEQANLILDGLKSLGH